MKKERLQKIGKRLLLEFSFPLILSIVWAFYKRTDLPAEKSPILFFIGNFSASFFFLSWITGQFFRIGKQQFVEDRLSSLLADIKSYSTGGNSYGVVKIISVLQNNENLACLYFENMGDFPLSDVSITFWNPDDTASKNIGRTDGRARIEDFANYKSISLGNFAAKGGRLMGEYLDVKEGEKRKINFSINARNGAFSETLVITKIEGRILSAWKINTITNGIEKSKVLQEEISEGFPKNEIYWK